MQSHQTDEQLISGYLQGNNNCFEQLLNRHKNKIFTYILLTVKDRDLAEDLFQDVFVKVITTLNKGTYNEEGKFLSWVMRVAHNRVIDHFRRDIKMQFVDNPEEGDDFDIFKFLVYEEKNAEEKIMEAQTAVEIRYMVEQLPYEQKEVLLMRHYGKMSFREIAAMTNVSINTCLGRMRFAIAKLRKMMEEKEARMAA